MKTILRAAAKATALAGLALSGSMAFTGGLQAAQQAACDAYGMYTDYCCRCQSGPLTACGKTSVSAKMSCLNALCDETPCSPW